MFIVRHKFEKFLDVKDKGKI